MARRTFIYGAIILFGANLLNRTLGFVYQYLIMRYIGGEAFGLFNMVFPMYMMALVITTAGVPLAVSKMISEEISLGRPQRAEAIFRFALIFLTVSGGIVAITLYVIAPILSSRFFPDARVLQIFKICTPAIFIVSISSAFRGYFQGLQNMTPTAKSQVSEQIVRVIIGFSLAYNFLAKGIEWSAAGLAIGMLSGEVIGLTVIIIQYLRLRSSFKKRPNYRSKITINEVKKLWQLSTPVTAGRFLSTGISTLDAILIPQRLQVAGFTAREATTLFGMLGGTAFTLVQFPSVFTFALSTSLVPAISEAAVKKHFQTVRSRTMEAIRLTTIIGLAFLITLYFYADEVALIFRSEAISPVLRILTLGGIFTYLQQTTTGILQGLGKVHLPVIHSIIAVTVRIPFLYVFTAIPQWGLRGSAWAYVLGFFVFSLLNLTAIIRHTGLALDLLQLFAQPLSAAMGMALVYHLSSPIFQDNGFLILIQLLIGLITYFLILLVNGGIRKSDLKRIPWIGSLIS